ncbi:MAG: sensor histidine kinase [Clostridia bacterium]
MGILNNLWLAISMPNEGLISFLSIPLTFIENFLTMYLFISILNVNSNKTQKFTYVILMSFISLSSMYILPNPFNVFFNYFMMILLIFIVFKLSILKSIIAAVSSAAIYSLVGFLVLNPYLTLLNLSSEQLMITPIYRLGYLCIMYLFVLLLIFFLKNRNLKLNILDDIDNKNKYIIFINFALGILALIIQSFITFYYLDKLPIVMTFLSFISLLAYFSVNIYSLTRVMKLNLTTKKLESAEEYNNTLRILHDNVRGFKHDFDNIVTTIGGYIRTNDMEGLKKYYEQLEDDCQRVNNLYILNPEIINNDGIYNLLTKKYHEADEKDIKVNITFLLDLATLHMKIYEFARILGILLDNAIEASSECKEKIINLTFRNDTKNSRQLIIIENSYSNKDIDMEKIFEKGISEKENHTGLGLWEVRKLIKKNNNINLYTSKNDKFFSQQLEIYY